MRFLLAFLTSFLLMAGTASAITQQGAQDVAAGHYGVPCGGNVTITWGHLGPDYEARSTWIGFPDQPASYHDCAITFNFDIQWDAPEYCTVMEHEYGHLTGHVHGEDAIMVPIYDKPSPECVAAAPMMAYSKVKRLTPSQLRKRWKKMLKGA